MRLFLFMGEDCNSCKEAKHWLVRNGISFREVDTSTDLEAKSFIAKQRKLLPLLKDQDTGLECEGFEEEMYSKFIGRINQ